MSQQMASYLYSRNLILIDARRTVSGSATTTSVDVSQYKGNGVSLIFYVDTINSSGNVTATIQASDTSGSSQVSITGATQTLSATGLYILFIPNVLGKYLNISWSLNSGTSVVVSTFAYGQPGEMTTNEGYTTAPSGQSGL